VERLLDALGQTDISEIGEIVEEILDEEEDKDGWR